MCDVATTAYNDMVECMLSLFDYWYAQGKSLEAMYTEMCEEVGTTRLGRIDHTVESIFNSWKADRDL